MKKRIRKGISMLLVFILALANSFYGKGIEIQKIFAYTYYNTSIRQTVNGVTWEVSGTVTSDSNMAGMYLSNITGVTVRDMDNLNVKDIVIPDRIQSGNISADITMLSEEAFKDNTKIESVTLNSKITSIGESCFSGCKNLKSVKSVNNTQAISVDTKAFYGCSNLETLAFVLGNVGMYAFTKCEKIKKAEIGGSGERVVGNCAFNGTDLSEISFAEELTQIKLGSSCFANTPLTKITIPCECQLSEAVFKNCTKLQKAEFKGKVTRKELLQMYSENSMYGAFENAFGMEYDEKGKMIEKEVIFHDSVTLQQYEKISSRTRGEFASCSGLTKVTFEGEADLPRWTFYNCIHLQNVNFNARSGVIKLGGSCFSGCKLNDLYFYTELYCVENDKELSDYEASPFYNSNVVNLYFTPFEKKGYSVNISANKLENVYFGENVDYIMGSIYGSRSVKKIVIDNPYLTPTELTSSNFAYSGRNLLKDTLTQRHYVIGYSSSDAALQNVEKWLALYSENGIFDNIMQKGSMKVSDLIYIGSVKKEDIDFSKLDVTYAKYDDITKEIKANASTDGTDIDGYVVENKTVPEILKVDEDGKSREYIYTVILMGEKVFGKIMVEPKKIVEMKVNWNKDNIKNLVANQPITLSDLVSDATIIYNDNEEKSIPLSELSLQNTKTTENKNTFTVTLKADANIKDTYTVDITSNYITDIKAVYLEEGVYVGQSIDVNKVKIYPCYKYDDDPQLNRNIEPTKISNTVITNEGENIIEVSYGEISTNLIVQGLKVIPTGMTAYFDSDNYKYMEGQAEIDKNSIKAKVNYNDGTYKEINGNDLDSIEIVSKLSTELGVKVKYQDIESSVFFINITPKQVEKIEVTASVKSAIEGTTLLKNMISQIDVTYNNKVTEHLTKETIDYDKLTLTNTEIKPNVENCIVVEYLGKTDTITIIGIPNTITGISAIYTGTGVPVGDTVKLDEMKVTAINANGVERVIENGCLLENAVIYNVGANNVIVHYGEFKCNVEVKGIATVTEPTAKVEATKEPIADNNVYLTPTPISASNSSIVSAPAITPTVIPNTEGTNAPVELPSEQVPSGTVTVTKSAVTFTSSVNSIKNAKKKSYKIVTNKKVVLTCIVKNATDLKYQFVKKGAAVKENKWKEVKKNKISIASTADKYGILYISYKDYTGARKKVLTTGFKIDKKKATVNIKNNQTYKKGKKVTFKDASGIKSAKLDGKNIKSGKKVTQNGNHTLVVVDKAGNKTKITFRIK